MFRRYFCLTVLLSVPAFVLLTAARADDDDDRPPPRPPAAPVLEWRDRRVFKTETRPFSIALSPDGKLLVASEWDKKNAEARTPPACIWDTRTGKEVARFDDMGAYLATFSPDSRMVVFFGSTHDVRIFDIARRKLVRQFDWKCWDLVFSPDGKLIGSTYDNELKIWEVASGKRLDRFAAFSGQASEFVFSPDGKTLAVSTASATGGAVYLLDMATGKEVRSFRPGSGLLAFSPDGSLLALESGAEKINKRDARTGKSFKQWQSVISLWNPRNGKLVRRLTWLGDDRKELDRYRDKFEFRPFASALIFSPDGRSLIAPCEDMWVRVWEVASGQQRYQFEEYISLLSPARTSTLCAGLMLEKKNLAEELVLWDARPALPRGRAAALPDADKVWAGLASTNAAAAFTFISNLEAAPREAVAVLDKRLIAVPILEASVIDRLLRNLDDDSFEVREIASQRLAEFGEAARPALTDALKAKPAPSAELSRRIKELLRSLDDPLNGERLRQIRAVEVLEAVATPEARRVLMRLAVGEPKALLTREAQAALGRLEAK